MGRSYAHTLARNRISDASHTEVNHLVVATSLGDRHAGWGFRSLLPWELEILQTEAWVYDMAVAWDRPRRRDGDLGVNRAVAADEVGTGRALAQRALPDPHHDGRVGNVLLPWYGGLFGHPRH